MSHNTANTVAFIAFLVFIGFLMVKVSPWFFVAYVFSGGGFLTEKEIEFKKWKQEHDVE